MEVRQTSLVDMTTALRCFEAGKGQDDATRRALERASVRYAYKGWGFEPRRMGEPSAGTQQDGSSAGARADVRDWRVNRSV